MKRTYSAYAVSDASPVAATPVKVIKRLRVKNTYKKKPSYSRIPRGYIQSAVKKALDNLTESKSVQYTWNQIGSGGLCNWAATTATWNTNNVRAFFPVTTDGLVIAQGTGEANRVGNSVRTRSLIYSGVIYPNQYNATYNPTPIPQEVCFMLISRKDTGDTNPGTFAALYESGNSSANPDGTVFDLVREINTDLYTVHYKRVFKIGAAENTGTGAVAGFQNYANTDFKYNQKFKMDLTKYIDKEIRFNDSSNGATAMKHYIWGVWMTCDADGTGSTHQPTCVTSQLVYKYSDA